MLDARLLAERAFARSQLELATGENDPADPGRMATLEALVARRLAGEPVARILGEKEFYGLSFVLNEATLVPRPETELLVDLALEWLRGRGEARILDLGTGTGCIPIAILANAPQVRAVAVDLSTRALEAARENAARHGVAERIVFLEGSWFEPLAAPSPVSASGRSTLSHEGRGVPGTGGGQGASLLPSWEEVPGEGGQGFDLIVSNPPYIESTAIGALAREVREHDPRLALDGGPDGLAPYHVIASGAPAWLEPGGALMVEIGADQGAAVAGILESGGLSNIVVHKDLAGLDRVVCAHHL